MIKLLKLKWVKKFECNFNLSAALKFSIKKIKKNKNKKKIKKKKL